jgi:hypothetical protein
VSDHGTDIEARRTALKAVRMFLEETSPALTCCSKTSMIRSEQSAAYRR